MSGLLKNRLIDDGILEFKEVIPLQMIQSINEVIDKKKGIKSNYAEYLNDAEAFTDNLRAIYQFAIVEHTCREIAASIFRENFIDPIREDTIYNLRWANPSMDHISYKRHFDSHLMTLLIPLQLANNDENNGDLILYKGKKSAISLIPNITRKFLTKIDQRRPIWHRMKKTEADLEIGYSKRITCKLGNVYFFNGYRCKHCNLSVSSGERRSLLIHAYAPQTTLGIYPYLRAMKIRRNIAKSRIRNNLKGK